MARPREFDADTAIDRAMEIFWSNGYETTSLDDLCEVMQLSRSSLYATFGSKRNLLLLSVDRYVEQRNPLLAAALAQPLPVREAFAALARQFIDQIVSGPGRRGCFLGNCAAELPRGDRAALARVRRGLEATQATFADALDRARARGELRPDADVQALARFMMSGFQGLRLVGKVNSDRAVLEDIITTMLECLESRLPPSRNRKGSRNLKPPIPYPRSKLNRRTRKRGPWVRPPMDQMLRAVDIVERKMPLRRCLGAPPPEKNIGRIS
jgi:TetR/AcrR family transcriptional repressor of nem operon